MIRRNRRGAGLSLLDSRARAELVRAIGELMAIVGHSSGAVFALEALVAAPSAFPGAVSISRRVRDLA